jgi:hypothetical protein
MNRKSVNIASSVWQKELTREDWDFSACPVDDWIDCCKWEMNREFVQRESGGRWPLESERAFPTIFFPTSSEVRRRALIDSPRPIGRWPKEFPRPYLIAKKVFKSKGGPYDPSGILGFDWHNWIRHISVEKWDQIIWGGEPLHFDGGIEFVPLNIPWYMRDDDIVAEFRKWLATHRPEVLPEPPPIRKKQGRKNPIQQAKFNLHALSASRLYAHFGNAADAKAEYEESNWFTPTYAHNSAYSKAKKRIETYLKQFS